MEYEDGSFVVMFTSATSGIVVYCKAGEMWPVGNYSQSWEDAKSKIWKPFMGEIILSNDD